MQRYYSPNELKIIASTPDLGLSGANVLLAQLLRGLERNGAEVKWLVSSHQGTAEAGWLEDLGMSFSVMPETRVSDVKARQKILLRKIADEAPCCYFPNYDFDMLWAVGAFPDDCRTVFIMHCDDPVYYEAIELRGSVLDAIVCVSGYLAAEVRRRWPKLTERVHHIPFGVEMPAEHVFWKPSLNEGPLHVVYCGRIVEEQKRIGDLADIILNCHHRNLPVRFHIAGDGPDDEAFFSQLEDPIERGSVVRLGKLPHDQVQELLGRCHVFILTSAYEGLPVSLLEAMAHGCVPVVTAVESGIPEVIDEGVNGFMLPIGDTEGITARLSELANNEAVLLACADRARSTLQRKGYTLEASVKRYLGLCTTLVNSTVQTRMPGMKRGAVVPPRYRWDQRLRSRMGWR